MRKAVAEVAFDGPLRPVVHSLVMDSIDVHDLPEEQARAIADHVEFLRKQFAHQRSKHPVGLPRWKGAVIGRLSREELYEDAD